METMYSLMSLCMFLYMRSTGGVSPGTTETTKNNNNLNGKQNTVLSSETGGLLETKNLSALPGQEVTLVVDNIKESEIQDIQWVRNGINFATTKPYKGVTIRERSYEGKLSSTSEGSLILKKVTLEDQGEYKADIFTLNLNHEITFILHISGGNDSKPVNAAAIIVPVILLLGVGAAGAFVIWKRKKRFRENVTMEKARTDPEGREPEEEELQQKDSSQSLQNVFSNTNDEESEVFHDALETHEKEAIQGEGGDTT
ncbi:hypothetical protein GDO81_014824 [Engystomops pustulosus]|uniref:Uncharacterized protein n=2 Tax=Engystomops pustulosus TaxID=76066 RepID=A0AAV7AFJ1_ENGPU|nr:hypothetical protein GDO81_014824 [Engystomops pustulosus]